MLSVGLLSQPNPPGRGLGASQIMQVVFDCLKEADLKLKPAKCSLFRSRVKFLGSIVLADGIKPNSEKVQAVAEWLRPQSLMVAQAFVTLASYYH